MENLYGDPYPGCGADHELDMIAELLHIMRDEGAISTLTLESAMRSLARIRHELVRLRIASGEIPPPWDWLHP